MIRYTQINFFLRRIKQKYNFSYNKFIKLKIVNSLIICQSKTNAMETNETKNVNRLKELTTLYFTTLKPTNDDSKTHTAQIKVLNYFELGCLITDLLKLCILALEHDLPISESKSSAVNVSLILETVLSIFPLDEMEFLGYVGEVDI